MAEHFELEGNGNLSESHLPSATIALQIIEFDCLNAARVIPGRCHPPASMAGHFKPEGNGNLGGSHLPSATIALQIIEFDCLNAARVTPGRCHPPGKHGRTFRVGWKREPKWVALAECDYCHTVWLAGFNNLITVGVSSI